MFPKRKTYLVGHEYQCRSISKGKSIEDFLSNKQRKPQGSVTWDVVRFTASSYFTFDGDRIFLKQMTCYDPIKGTFQTPEAFFQLFPLPTV